AYVDSVELGGCTRAREDMDPADAAETVLRHPRPELIRREHAAAFDQAKSLRRHTVMNDTFPGADRTIAYRHAIDHRIDLEPYRLAMTASMIGWHAVPLRWLLEAHVQAFVDPAFVLGAENRQPPDFRRCAHMRAAASLGIEALDLDHAYPALQDRR